MQTKWRRRSARCSVSDEEDDPGRPRFRGFVLGGALLAAVLGAAWIARPISPPQEPSAQRQTRPMVQILRQQPGLPDLADLIDRLCPSVAIIVPHGETLPPDPNGTPAVPASAYSADGWLVTSAADLPSMPLDAVFGDGRRVAVDEVRTDPVSGLAIAQTASAASPLAFSDQAFPRVGQFGFALAMPLQ